MFSFLHLNTRFKGVIADDIACLHKVKEKLSTLMKNMKRFSNIQCAEPQKQEVIIGHSTNIFWKKNVWGVFFTKENVLVRNKIPFFFNIIGPTQAKVKKSNFQNQYCGNILLLNFNFWSIHFSKHFWKLLF